jgi:dGTPase
MQTQWRALLLDSRVSRDNTTAAQPPEGDPLRSPFEADYDRVIYSTPFRRLARKTQVHPLALNDHVRTRLTHSLEVGCVGRSLGKKLAGFLQAKGHMPVDRSESDLVWIMLSACAAHDIGNPPFGHAGEYAIREWVTTHETEVFGKHSVSPGVRSDLALFEGNAQGFRIAARPDNPKTGYLRLTYATLGAMIKYPWHSEDKRAQNQKKFNVFSTEQALFEAMMTSMGLSDSKGTFRRHPMSFLTEAADDICYRILDLEDAVEIGILDEKRVRDLYATSLCTDTKGDSLAVLRGKVIRALIEGVWEVFEQDYANIMAGTRTADLKSGLKPDLAQIVASIKTLYQEIFAERSKVAAELGAYKALGRIVKALCAATGRLAEGGDYDKAGFLSHRCLELAWGEGYARAHQNESYDWWLHQVMDYVSGLTDNYARQLSREIEGT